MRTFQDAQILISLYGSPILLEIKVSHQRGAFRVNFFGYLLMVEVKCVPFISHMKIIDNQISSVYKRKRIVEYMH